MSKHDYASLPSKHLVELFENIALQQDQAELRGEVGKIGKLFWELEAIEAELKSRLGDQRRLLIPLYGHRNAQVRIKAIKATLAVNPKEARRQLEILAKSHDYPPSAEAAMSLQNLDKGIFKPT